MNCNRHENLNNRPIARAIESVLSAHRTTDVEDSVEPLNITVALNIISKVIYFERHTFEEIMKVLEGFEMRGRDSILRSSIFVEISRQHPYHFLFGTISSIHPHPLRLLHLQWSQSFRFEHAHLFSNDARVRCYRIWYHVSSSAMYSLLCSPTASLPCLVSLLPPPPPPVPLLDLDCYLVSFFPWHFSETPDVFHTFHIELSLSPTNLGSLPFVFRVNLSCFFLCFRFSSQLASSSPLLPSVFLLLFFFSSSSCFSVRFRFRFLVFFLLFLFCLFLLLFFFLFFFCFRFLFFFLLFLFCFPHLFFFLFFFRFSFSSPLLLSAFLLFSCFAFCLLNFHHLA